jgi:hypothetical protein
MKRFVLWLVVASAIGVSENLWYAQYQNPLQTGLAIAQVNGGDAGLLALRRMDALKDIVPVASVVLIVAMGIWAISPLLRRLVLRYQQKQSAPVTTLLLLFISLPLLTGCKPYDRPEYVEIDTSDTGFLIPLEGESGQQAHFQSEAYLRERKVAAKRIQITHRWSQEGRMGSDGRWIPAVRLIKVNRAPITREWTMSERNRTDNQHRPDLSDKAIWIESADSVGFSMGFTCTAFITEEDASRFLYWYPSGTLSDVMDREMRGRIQQTAAEVAARYPLDELRSKKQEISDAVKKDLTNYFSSRGITVSTVGMFGGMTYENPAIQKAIDETFIAQQLKVVSAAKYEAQQKVNDRIRLEAEGLAERARREAMGLADARKTAAEAEATAIREVNRAAQEAQSNPLLLQLKTLEVEKARVERWDGKYPQWWMGGGGASPNLMFSIPTPPIAAP